jgi:TonB family protein
MKQLIMAAILFGAVCSAAAGGDDATQDLLTRAEQQADLFSEEAGPFQLDVNFVMQTQPPIEGQLSLKWQGHDRWWRSIVAGDFRQIDVRNGEKLFTSRNYSSTPLRILELLELLQFAHPDDTSATKQSQRSENGVQLTCIKVRNPRVGDDSKDICVNPSSYEISSNEWKDSPDVRRREEFADYFEFRAHRYPRELQLLVNGNKSITAHVNKLVTAPLEDALLTPPKDAIERRQCPGMRHAVPIKTPDPAYPTSAKDHHVLGDTFVSITVLTDGSVGNVQLLESSTQSLDDATLKTLRGWKFKPATCGTEPIVSDLAVKVSFRLF